jgi:integrase
LQTVTNWLIKVSDIEGTRRNYTLRITDFAKYMKEAHSIDIETLKEDYRDARYKGEIEREKFIDRLQDAIEDYICVLKTRNYTNMHVKMGIAIVSSFIRKGCKIKDIDIDIPKRTYAVFHNQDITKEVIKKLLEHATLRDRTFFLFLAETGLRPSTALHLTYDLIKRDYEANIIPMKIDLPSKLLKDRISARWTFLGEDGFKVLKEYLSTRESIKDNDYIFAPERPTRMKAKVITESALSNKFNKLVLKLGLDASTEKGKPKSLRLYTLRKFFFNNMKADSAYRNFWFCHKTIDDHYISTQEEKHREEYLKGYKSLRVFEPNEDVRIQALANELEKTKKELEELRKFDEIMQTRYDKVVNLYTILKESNEETILKIVEEWDRRNREKERAKERRSP